MRTLKKHSLVWLSLALLVGCISPELRTTRIAINEKDWERALRSADAEIARMPNSAEAYYWKGFIYEQMRDWEKMAQSYQKALELSDQYDDKINRSRSTLVGRYFQRSLRHYDLGDSLSALGEPAELTIAHFDSALAYLDTAIIVNDKDVRLHRQAAVVAFYGEHYDRAIASAMTAIGLEPAKDPDMSVRQVLLSVYRAKKDYDKTIEWARNLMNIVDPTVDTTGTYLTSLDALVEAYEKKEDHESAQGAVQEAINRFPDRADLRLNLAYFLIRKKDYAAAAEVYRAVLKIQPDNFDANLNLGTILVNESQFAESIPYLEKAYGMDPSNRIAVQNLASAYYNTDQLEKGAKLMEVLEKLPE